jgi:hypothetical protein
MKAACTLTTMTVSSAAVPYLRDSVISGRSRASPGRNRAQRPTYLLHPARDDLGLSPERVPPPNEG